MRYLKEYYSDEKDIENLIDCLYEIFDEYKIPKRKHQTNKINWFIDGINTIKIEKIPAQILDIMFLDIERMSKTINKRINGNLSISKVPDYKYGQYEHTWNIYLKII